MKPLTLLFILVPLAMLFSGCAAPYADKEFGKAQMLSFDSQIAYPDYRYAHSMPDALEGILAEEVMRGYFQSFKQGFSKQDIDITSTGINSDNETK